MPRRCIREYEIKKLLSRHLGSISGVSADFPALLVDSHSNLRLALQSRMWLLRPGARFSCAPDVLLPYTALPNHAADGLDADQLLAFLDRHVGTSTELPDAPHTRGVLTHFTVSPCAVPATPDDVYSLVLESKPRGISVAFGRCVTTAAQAKKPAMRRLCVPIDGNVCAMRVAETLAVPAGVAQERAQDVADFICAVVKFFDELEFTSLRLEPLVLLAPSAVAAAAAAAAANESAAATEKGPAHTRRHHHFQRDDEDDGDDENDEHEDRAYHSDTDMQPQSTAAQGLSSPQWQQLQPQATAATTTTGTTGTTAANTLFGTHSPLLVPGGAGGAAFDQPQRHILMPHTAVPMPAENTMFNTALRAAAALLSTPQRHDGLALFSPQASPLMAHRAPPLQRQKPRTATKHACMVPVHASGALDTFAEFRQAERWGGVDFPQPWGHKPQREERAIDKLNRAIPAALQNTGTSSTLQLTVLNPAGRVWFIASGAGSAMIYADTVIANGMGHELANYCEYSGHATEDQTYQLCRAVLLQATAEPPPGAPGGRRRGRVLLLGGCIANYADVSRSLKGFDHAIREFRDQIQRCGMLILVRRAGPNYHAALRTMHLCRAETGLDFRA